MPITPQQAANSRAGAIGPEYADPLAAAKVTPERIDQGVDYSGSGTISAIARGVVTAVSGTGWPGDGGFVEYTITDHSSPLFGQSIYQAEGVRPVGGLRVGQVLNPGDPVATIDPASPTGIEIGFGSGVGSGTYASGHGGYTEGEVTPAGQSFSDLIAALGAPAGTTEGRSAGAGTAPPGVSQLTGKLTGSGNLASSIANTAAAPFVAVGSAVSTVASGVGSAINAGEAIGNFVSNPVPVLLTITLVLGGGLLVFSGLGRMLGFDSPVASSAGRAMGMLA